MNLSITINLLIIYKVATLILASIIAIFGVLLVLFADDQKEAASLILGFIILGIGIVLGWLVFI